VTAPSPPRTSTLDELPFTLTAEALAERGQARIASAERALAALADAPAPPTLATFLEPLDRLLTSVRDLSAHGGLLFAVHPEEPVRASGRSTSEAADRFFNAFRLNGAIYAKLGALRTGPLDPATRFAIEKMRREMRRAGVEHDAPARARLLELSNAIDATSNEFTENIARSRRFVELDGPDRLAGLPDDYRRSHGPGPEGRIRISTDYPDFRPAMTYADDAELRRRLLLEFTRRAYPENEAVLARLLALRQEFATLLGYPSYAAYALEDKMIETPERAAAFLERVSALVHAPAQADLARLLERKRKDLPGAPAIENGDLGLFAEGYYAAKIKSEEFGVDPKRLRAYLPYAPVRDALFALCQELFGLAIRPVQDAALWHPSIEAYDVTAGERAIGRFYLDMVPREGKYNHAACFGVREGLLGGNLPQSALVCNFIDPASDPATARLEYTDVVTFFHEFGHLLHALLSGHGRWLYNSQSSIEWDFVEAPSQLFEEWARDPATVRRFARDPDTGEALPETLLERMRGAEAFGRASRWARQVALAAASLDLYGPPTNGHSPHAVLLAAYARHAPLPLDDAYHFEASWGHLTGYSAFYYTYVWSMVIARDLLSPFETAGRLDDRAIAERYAREILAPGSERPAAELVKAYLGREFQFDAFERWVRAPALVPRARPAPASPATPGPL
jgi:thimet oligopeptidase